MYKLCLFGGFSLTHDGRSIQLRSVKQRCVLAWLAVHSPDRSTRDQIAEQLWGWGEPGRSRQSLRTALSALRKQLGAEEIFHTSGDEVWLDPETTEVDLVEFESLCREPTEASLREAAELYKGAFLAGTSVGENEIDYWIGGVRDTYQTRALEIFVNLAERRAAIGRFDQAIGYARHAVEIDALSEEAQRALISNLVASNRRADALRQANAFMKLFESELSTVPSAESLALIESLQVSPPTRTSPVSNSPALKGVTDLTAIPQRGMSGLVERRPITALAYDIIGLDAASMSVTSLEELAETVSLIERSVQNVADEWFGTVESSGYDGGVIVFGHSDSTENQHDDAVEAALDLAQAVANLRPPSLAGAGFDISLTIDTATSLIKGDEAGNAAVMFSPSVLLARRLNKARTDGGIVITSRVRERLAASFELAPVSGTEAAGGAQEETLWRVGKRGRARTRFMVRTRRVLHLIDRKREMDLLFSRWRDLTISGGQVVVIRGHPGIGKSRLLHEFQSRLGAEGARTVFLQCSPEGTNIALSPLVNLISRRNKSKAENLDFLHRLLKRLRLSDVPEMDQLGVALGFDTAEENLTAANQREANRRVRRSLEALLEAMTGLGPVCIQVEDTHWADASTIAQIQHLSEWISDKPVLLILTSRLDPLRSISDAVNVTNVLIRKLDANDSLKLTRSIWESMTDESINPEVAEKIRGYGDGVPLFLEELVYWYRKREEKHELDLAIGEDWIDESPPVAELVMSRLNALGASKRVAQIASAIGASFDEALLAEICGEVIGLHDIERSLQVLIDHEIVRQTWPKPVAEYEFRHILLREAAYGSLRDADRRFVHGKIFARMRRDADAGAPVNLIDLARHAQACGESAAAAATLLQAGRETASRMALTEATQLLSNALDASDSVDLFEKRLELQLSIIAALGPLMSSQFGPRDVRSSAIYNRGVGLARQLPPQDRARYYAVFWGWWYTGRDFREMRDRAIRVQEMLGTVEDPEIVLQTNHCIWAIDFNLGNHQSALEAIERGLERYDEDRAAGAGVAQFGGHDAKVCGLGQKALLLWLTGREAESNKALEEMTAFVARLNHAPSTAHSLDTEAVSAFYRDDHDKLIEISGRMETLATAHNLQVLDGLSRLFGGWAIAHTRDPKAGMKMFVSGLETMESLGSAGDLPLYLYMHATILQRAGGAEMAMSVIERAIETAEESGHSYWLAELCRRRASLRASLGGEPDLVLSDLHRALQIAASQQAKALVTRVRGTAEKLRLQDAL